MSKKSILTLNTDTDNLLTSNGNNEITGALLNTLISNLIDSSYNKITDKDLVEKFIYQTSNRNYNIGDLCIKDGRLLICKTATSGAFDPSDWRDPMNALIAADYHTVNEGSNRIDLDGTEEPLLVLSPSSGTVTINRIINGVHGRTYRIHLDSNSTAITLTDTAAADAISNGVGEMAISTTYAGEIASLVGRDEVGMGDWFEFTYFDPTGSAPYVSVTKIQKHG